MRKSTSGESVLPQNQTVYFAKFDLFDQSLDWQFLRYQLLQKTLRHRLGRDWADYAREVLPGETVFDRCLMIWLEIKREHAFRQEIDVQDLRDADTLASTGNGTTLDPRQTLRLFRERFEKESAGQEPSIQCSHLVKPLLVAFLEVAQEAWREVVVQQQNPSLDDYHPPASYGLESIVQPLVVAKEFILDLLDFRDKKKHCPSPLPPEQLQEQKHNLDNFLESGQQAMMQQFEEMTLGGCSPSRRGSIKRVASQDSVKMVHIQKIDKQLSKSLRLDQSLLSSLGCFVQDFLAQGQSPWMVVRGIVTNSVNVDYGKLADYSNSKLQPQQTDFRFYQPAQDFYHHLLKVFLILQTNRRTPQPGPFLNKVRDSLGPYWSDKYIGPVQFFLRIMSEEWEQSSKVCPSYQQEQVIRHFIRAVRSSLLITWDQQFVQKFESLQNKNLYSTLNNTRQWRL